MPEPIKRRDTLKPWLTFRDAVTGRYVSRIYALLNPATTISHKRWTR